MNLKKEYDDFLDRWQDIIGPGGYRTFTAGYYARDDEVYDLENAIKEQMRFCGYKDREIERKDKAIDYCSNMIICAINSMKYGYTKKADEQLNSGLSTIQEALSKEE